MKFTVEARDKSSSARSGILQTPHGVVHTPAFMPVGTVGSVKAVHQRELVADIGSEIILGNTYHLFLRPGMVLMRQAGGLHKFMGWERSILTDSGGYQVFSLSANRDLDEGGVTFRSHIDGSSHRFTPESVIEHQRVIGADIIMALDECTPYPCTAEYAKESMDLTHAWLDRCIAHDRQTEPLYGYAQTLFPIVQGSTYQDLRAASAEYVSEKGMEGNAIGGLSVGEPHEVMYEMTDLVCRILPAGKPRYLMGVGTPENILESIALGVDLFDCVMPTRNGRNGFLFTTGGVINIRNEKWKDDFSPIDPGLTGYASTYYTRAYLRHLMISKEILGAQIASIHNLSFYAWLVREAGKRILNGSFASWKSAMVKQVSRRL